MSGVSDYQPKRWGLVSSMMEGLDFWTRRKESPKQNITLLSFLTLRRGSGHKIASDLVYSLLGAAWECPPIEIDYRQPTAVVFAKTTKAIIHHDHRLAIFGTIEEERLASDLPSWVPDWRVSGPTTGISTIYCHHYAATGQSQAKVSMSSDAQELTIHGLRLDAIIDVIVANAPDVYGWVEGQYTKMYDGETTYHATQETVQQALYRICCLDLTEFDPGAPTTRWKKNSAERFEYIRAHFSDGQEGRQRYASLLLSLMRNSLSRSIFITAHGYLGIASHNIRPGDIVTLLLGGEKPLILRLLDNEHAYTLVGECYLHGFMDGEGLIDARRRVQPENDAEDTSWLQRLHEEPCPFPPQAFTIA